MKRLVVIAVVFLMSITAFSQIKSVKINLTKDTIITKQVVDSTKAVAVIGKEVIAKQADSLQAKDEKISELKQAIEKNLFGGKSGLDIFFGSFWALLGIVFTWCMISLTGTLSKTNKTPNKWDWGIFFNPRNVMRRIASMIASFIIIFAFMVFADSLSNTKFTMFYCFGIGLVSDLLIFYVFKIRKKFSPVDLEAEPEVKNP